MANENAWINIDRFEVDLGLGTMGIHESNEAMKENRFGFLLVRGDTTVAVVMPIEPLQITRSKDSVFRLRVEGSELAWWNAVEAARDLLLEEDDERS